MPKKRIVAKAKPATAEETKTMVRKGGPNECRIRIPEPKTTSALIHALFLSRSNALFLFITSSGKS